MHRSRRCRKGLERSRVGTTKSGIGAGEQYISIEGSMMEYEGQCGSQGLPGRPLRGGCGWTSSAPGLDEVQGARQ